MSTGAIVMIVIAGLVTGVFVPLRVAVAKQRRAVETVRARLAASKTVRRRAEGVAVEAIQKLGASVGRVSRSSTCALADDGLYCLSDDGRWGARVRLAPGTPEIGDVVLAARPCLVTGGSRRRARRPPGLAGADPARRRRATACSFSSRVASAGSSPSRRPICGSPHCRRPPATT